MSELVPLPELPPPPGAEACALCQLSRQRSRVIWAEGHPGAPLMVLLDNPGAREDTEGTPFVCGTRQALREAARAACLPYLGAQLAEHRPRVIVCLGNVAAQTLLGDPEAEVKRLRGRVHTVDGHSTVFGYHPLAVRRRPNLMATLVEDLRLAASCL